MTRPWSGGLTYECDGCRREYSTYGELPREWTREPRAPAGELILCGRCSRAARRRGALVRVS